jgi:tRNA(Ile)-lysidine synthase
MEEVDGLARIEGSGRRRGHPSLVRKVEALARREGLFPAGTKALVMLSGGQDSLAMLHILAGGGLGSAGPAALHVLHINHHLRGAESDADEALAVEACERLGVELTVVHCPIEKGSGNVQEAARDARRRAADQVALATGCDVRALGHTADDQVETLLYRMGRYGGLAALSGMLPNDPPWVRPLLGCRRQQTEAYCRENGLDFARDSGNAYPGYARTRIREVVLPAWESALPGAVEAAARTAEVAAEVKAVTDGVVAEALPRVLASLPDNMEAGDEVAMNCSALLALPSPVRRLVLHDRLATCATEAASRAAVLAVESLLVVPGSASRVLGGGWRAVKQYDILYVQPGGKAAAAAGGGPDPVELPVPGLARWAGHEVAAELCEGLRAVEVEREAIIDADCFRGTLEIRGARPGDRIRPLGAPGSRRLKEVLIDLKVPAGERATRPLVVSGERILWAGGLVIAEEAKVTPQTTRFLRLSTTSVDGGEHRCAH